VRQYRLSRAPRSLRCSTVYMDNVALVPASLLPLNPEWEAVANSLLPGESLIVLPGHAKQQRVARSVASQLRAKGKRVKMIDSVLWQTAL
jgi:hypothetical protein